MYTTPWRKLIQRFLRFTSSIFSTSLPLRKEKSGGSSAFFLPSLMVLFSQWLVLADFFGEGGGSF